MTLPMTPPAFAGPAAPGTAAPPEAVIPLTGLHPVARVDLMPPEVLRQRRFRRARRLMGLSVVGTALVAAAVSVGAWQGAVGARGELAEEQARPRQLQAEAARFAEVPAVLGSIERARTSLSVTMGQEVGWYPVLDDITRSAPETVWFEQITLTAVPSDAVVEDPLATPGAVADVEMTGRALDHQDVVAWLDGMAGLATWTDPVFTESATETGEAADAGAPLTFTTSARLSAEAYTQRFDPSQLAGTTAGGDDR
ncbi:MAG: PilN domain-containing protein [Kineosporiaceae bacterium]